MNYKDMSNTLFGMWKHAQANNKKPVSVVALGPPGVGKTACGRMLGDMMTEYVRSKNPDASPAVVKVLDLSSMLPEDLMGLPFRDNEVTRYCPQSWMHALCQEGAYGVLILDDLPAAASQVQVACRQVSLERRIHEMKLSDGIFVMITGNRREDKSAASTLPAHFRNSVVLLPFQPDFEGWESWYMDQGFDPEIPAFLRYKKEHFSRLPKDADEAGAFATPRTWSLLGQLLPSVSDTVLPDIAAGLVGNGVASEYAAFRMVKRELVSPERVLEDPKAALPDLSIMKGRPDRMIAVVTGLGELVARTAKGPKAQQILTKYLEALAYVTSKEREYVSVSISTFTACKGKMPELLKAARDGSKNPAVTELIKNLAATLSS